MSQIRDSWDRLDVYHLILIFLVISGLSAVYLTKNISFLLQLVVAPLVAALLDIAINYAKTRSVIKPLTAMISGLIIALVLPASLIYVAAASAIAIVSKHVIRWKGRKVFNPAAFGVILAAFIFGTDTSWWISVSLLTLLGFLVVFKLGRLRTSLAFLAAYFVLVYATTQQILPDMTAIFFATIMLIEPKTSPYTKKGMIVFGIATALLAVGVQPLQLGKDTFLVSLLVMNLFTGLINKKLK